MKSICWSLDSIQPRCTQATPKNGDGHNLSKFWSKGVMCGLESWESALKPEGKCSTPKLPPCWSVLEQENESLHAQGSLSALTNLCRTVGDGWALCSVINRWYTKITHKRWPTVTFRLRYTVKQYNLMKSASGLGCAAFCKSTTNFHCHVLPKFL